MKTIYFIVGWGADSRMFEAQLNALKEYEIIVLEWLVPLQNETISHYASRMCEKIDLNKKNITLVGVSMGGMISIEMAKQISIQQHIIIASIKTKHELSKRFLFLQRFPAYRLLSPKVFVYSYRFSKHFIRLFIHKNHFVLFDEMYKNCPPEFLKWGIEQIVHWQNEYIPPKLVHIHGTHDRTFPLANIRNAVVVEKGTHFMNMDLPLTINYLIRKHIEK